MRLLGRRLGEREVRFSVARSPLLAAALSLALVPVLVSDARGYVYWANNGVNGGGTTIGRATLGGAGTNQSFITGATSPKGVAVGGGFIYWSNFATGTIGRARIDGSAVNQSFITGVLAPQGLAVDDTYVYWANQGGNAIGRARLDGTGVDQDFIAATADPYGVAVDGTYVYWVSGAGGAIGRASKADGSAANHVFISPAGFFPDGLAVSAGRIYWTNYAGMSISRAKLNGTGANGTFIPKVPGPSGIAADGAHLYWSNYDAGSIGISTLKGTGVDRSFITGAGSPWGLAVDALGPSSPAPVLDTAAPVQKLSGSRRQDVDKLVVRVRSSEAAVVHATAKVTVRHGRGTRTLSFRAAWSSVDAGVKHALRLRLGRADLRAVKRAIARGQTPGVRVRVSAVDTANNRGATAKRTVRLTD